MVSGDARTIEFAITDQDGAAMNLDGYTARWAMSRLRSAGVFSTEITLLKTLGTGLNITNAAGGLISVSLDPIDTAELVGPYYHELEVRNGDTVVFTAASGIINILRDLLQ